MRYPNTSHQRTQADNNQNKINSININQTNKNQQNIYQPTKPINQITPNNINKSKIKVMKWKFNLRQSINYLKKSILSLFSCSF
ncbi:MAG: hypothetical protein IKK93_04100 [Campylobacter sp.]|nr:hypothetical protein [Campylobacter sp.]